jgi:hypothetical protein
MVDRERRIEFGRLSYKVTELLLRLSLVHTQEPRDKTREREGFTGVKESKRVTSLSLASLEVPFITFDCLECIIWEGT